MVQGTGAEGEQGGQFHEVILMVEHVAYSEVRIQADVDQELAFKITMEEIDDGKDGRRLLSPGGSKTIDIVVYPFQDIELLKRILCRKLRAGDWLKISDIQIYFNGVELANRRSLITFAEQTEPVIFRWKVKEKLGKQMVLRSMRGVGGMNLSSKYTSWIDLIVTAFQKNVHPKLTSEGTGSSYIVCNVFQKPIGIFKPQNEEAFCPFNPRGYIGRMGQKGFRAGVVSGEGYIREIAAYYLDAYYGSLSSVPPTIMVEAIHPKFCYEPPPARGGAVSRAIDSGDQMAGSNDAGFSWKTGSLQMFVDSKESCGDYDSSVFSVSDVHKIGILDVRLCNMDRNEGNILVVKEDQKFMDPRLMDLLDESEFMKAHERYREQHLLTVDGRRAKYRLIPIDHGLTLPDCFDVTDFDLIWIRWPQAKIGFSQDELEYIEKLKPDKDAEWLTQKMDIRPECLCTMQICTRLLKKGAKLGMNLHQISLLMVRLSPNEPSPLELWVKQAITNTWYSSYQADLVAKRTYGVGCVMDLAARGEAQVKRNKWTDYRCLPLHEEVEFEDSTGSLPRVDSASRGGNNRTSGRPDPPAKPRGAKHKNYTNWARDLPAPFPTSFVCSKQFLDAFENILSLRMPCEAERHF